MLKLYRNTFLNDLLMFKSIFITTLIFNAFFKTFFEFSILDIFKNVHFQKAHRLFKFLIQPE